MNKSVIGGVIALVVLAVIGFAVIGSDDSGSDQVDEVTIIDTESADDAAAPADDMSEEDTTADNSDQTETETPATPALTAVEVSAHSSSSDCWTIISEQVYDITEYVQSGRHPGGDEVLRACGTDGTSLFNERTTADGETVGSGTAHSGGAAAQLEAFLLGDLDS